MKSLIEYTSKINDTSYLDFVQESLDNNTRIINENHFIVEHARDLDNLIYKFKSYTTNHLYYYNQLNENDNQYKLSLKESQTFRDLMIYICEDYRDRLLEELNIYESLIVDGELITEGKLDNLKSKYKDIVGNIKSTWKQGKDKVKQAIEEIKIKLKEVYELIKEYANKAISTVKEMAVKLVELLNKFDCTLEELFKKMGFDTDKEAQEVEAIGANLAGNPDYLKKNNVYESFANSLNILNEDDKEQNQQDAEQNQDNKGEVVQQAEKKGVKQMLWEGFKQLMIWAGVCVILPGFIVGLFPGTFIALIVPIACKLLWNAYKIVKLVKQWKKVKQEWGTYGKVQKILVAGGMIASIVAIVFNFGSIANSIGKIWEAFTKSGCDLLAEAHCGVQPDVLQRGFGAIVKMIKEGKFSFQDFQQSFKDITDSFAEIIPQADKVVKVTAQVGKSGKDLLDEYGDKTFKSSTKAWTEFLKPAGMDPDKIDPKGVYDVVMDGSQDAKWFAKLSQFASDNGVSLTPDKGFNAGLNKLCSNAGSITGAKIPGWLIKKAMDEGINIGNKGIFSILGGIIETTQNVPMEDLVNAATSMLVTIPSVEFAPQNNGGFRVRLGGENDEKNFVYEVGKEGVRKGKVSDFKDQYDKIKEHVKEVNVKFLEELKDNDKIDEDKKKEIEQKLEEFNKKYQEEIDKQEAIIIYGTKVKEKTEAKESYKSLYNYLLLEAKKAESVQDVIDNLTALRNHLQSKCTIANKENDDNDNTNNNQSNTFGGNVEMLLKRIFSFKSPFKLDLDDKSNELSYKEKKEKKIYTTNDIDIVALYLSKYVYNDTDNDKYFEELRKALIDVTIIKNQAKENPDNISDELKGAYNNMLELLKKSPKFKKESDGDEPEWEPLYFDEVAPEIQDKIQDAENKLPETTPEETEKELKDNDIVIPEPEQKEEDNNKDDENKEDNNEKPIIIFANLYGMDIADANDKGPRKDPYSLKGVFHSITISEIEGGTSKTNIQKLFGDILSTQTAALYNIVANKPCTEDKKHKLNSWNKGDEERADFGMLTNQDITDVLNNPNKAKDFVLEKSSISIVRSDEDKEYLKEKQDKYKEKLENPSDEEKEILKKMGALDDEGKVKDIESISSDLASYQLAQKQSKEKGAKEDKGLWSKLKSFVKGLFGGDKKKGELNNQLLKHFESDSTNESLQEDYNNFLNEVFKPLTLNEYLIHKKFNNIF